jgi:hypothetical protein
MNIDLRESNHNPITGYLVPTVERGKELAAQELREYGHVMQGLDRVFIRPRLNFYETVDR